MFSAMCTEGGLIHIAEVMLAGLYSLGTSIINDYNVSYANAIL